jgi:hypothetical protein
MASGRTPAATSGSTSRRSARTRSPFWITSPPPSPWRAGSRVRASPSRSRPLVAQLRVPVTVLLGAVPHPAAPDPAELAALAPLGRRLRVEWLAGVGHFPHEEAPGAVARHLLAPPVDDQGGESAGRRATRGRRGYPQPAPSDAAPGDAAARATGGSVRTRPALPGTWGARRRGWADGRGHG